MPQKEIKRVKWTKEKEDFIRSNYKEMTVKELANYFCASEKAVRAKIERMGLNLRVLGRQLAALWTEEDLEYLRENWLYTTDEDIAIHLGLSRGFNKNVVYRKRESLGLKGKSHRIRSDKQGYKYWIDYDTRIYTHRSKIEELIGRKLEPTEIVHHIDGDKSNDDIENLYLCNSVSEHTLLHDNLEKLALELVREGKISFDKKEGKYKIE